MILIIDTSSSNDYVINEYSPTSMIRIIDTSSNDYSKFKKESERDVKHCKNAMVWKYAHPHSMAPKGMTKEWWDEKQLSYETYLGYIQEKTERGVRIIERGGRPTIDRMHLDDAGVNFVFANCLHCTRQDFTGNFKSGMDPGIKENDPNTPRLGRCGCVCCTRCVLVSERTNRGWDGWIACPACGYKKSQHQDEIFWIVNAEFFDRMDAREVEAFRKPK